MLIYMCVCDDELCMLKSITSMFSSVLCLDEKDSELIVQMCSLVWVVAVQIRLILLHSFQRICLGVFSDKSGIYFFSSP